MGFSKTPKTDIPFNRAADLEGHARAHQPVSKEHGSLALGCARKGTEGFTRKDKLADHCKFGFLGILGEIGAWMV